MYQIIFFILIVQWIIRRLENRSIAKNFGWRAYKKSYDTFVYGQKFGDTWKEIEISRAYRFNRGNFYLDFKSADEWKEYPSWAHDREKIMQRVLSLFPNHKPYKTEIDDIGSS